MEQTSLTRAKATLLLKAMFERVAYEQDARKKAETQEREKKTKLLSDMFMIKTSELCKMAVDDRVRSLLKSESSQKGKGKGKGKGKNKMFDHQKLYSLYHDHNRPLSEDQVEQVMLRKNVKSPAGAGAKSSTSKGGKGSKPWKGKGTGKGKKSGQEKGKTQPQASKGKNKGKSSGKGKQAKGQPSLGKGKGKVKNKKGFTGGESNKDWKSVR